MDKTFRMASQLIGDIFHLAMQPLDSKEAIARFSQASMLHSSQSFLEESSLNFFLEEMEADKFYYITDRFQVQYIMLRLGDIPIAVGPFCTLIWTEQDCVKYLHRMAITEISARELLAYRSRFPVINERESMHIVQSCIRLFDPSAETWPVAEIDHCHSEIAEKQHEKTGAPLRKNYSELINERYQVEQRFVSDIEEGNAHSAILNLRKMQQDVEFLKKMGTTLENERVGAAIVRTMLRVSALRVGLPAPTIDLLSRKNTVATIHATTVEEIYKEKEKMVRAFCREIQAHKDHQYSNLVLSVVHYIEHQYAQDLSVQQIADELNVNVNHLTAIFRRETGSTPGTFIRQTRMKHAVRFLTSTDLSVQGISNMVGIPDANYFIKLFKKEYDLTPTQYRKYNRL